MEEQKEEEQAAEKTYILKEGKEEIKAGSEIKEAESKKESEMEKSFKILLGE